MKEFPAYQQQPHEIIQSSITPHSPHLSKYRHKRPITNINETNLDYKCKTCNPVLNLGRAFNLFEDLSIKRYRVVTNVSHWCTQEFASTKTKIPRHLSIEKNSVCAPYKTLSASTSIAFKIVIPFERTLIQCKILYQHTPSFFTANLNFQKYFFLDTSTLKLSLQVKRCELHTKITCHKTDTILKVPQINKSMKYWPWLVFMTFQNNIRASTDSVNVQLRMI